MRRIILLAVVSTTLGVAAEALATPAPTPTPVAIDDPAAVLLQFRAALARAPAIAAARARVAAAEQAQGAAGLLPDPMVGVDIGRERTRTGEEMPMYGAMIEQALPRWGERDAKRQAARAQVGLESANVAAVIGDHAVAVATGIAEWMAARDTEVLVRQSRERIGALREVVRARIAAGSAMIGDQLALDTKAQQLDLQLADLERRQADALGMVRGRLGLSPDAPVPSFAAPDPATIRVEANPMARSADAMQVEAQAMEREAVARGNPETAVGLTWEREAAGTDEQTDKLAFSFRVSLPIYRSAYSDVADAARTRARAARHEASGSTWMARSQVGRAQRAIAQAQQAQRAADDIAARTLTEYDAVIQQVGSGGATVTQSLNLLDMIAESGMNAVMARLDSQMALAELWRLDPPDLPIATLADDGDDPTDHH
jgi:cobalt-zinc-cadmium efflux system outer membrane protein